jgi:zinc transport system substrate-binding protein
MNTESMRIFAMMNAVELVEEEFVEGMEHDHHHSHDHDLHHDHHHAHAHHHDHHHGHDHHHHHECDDECDHDHECDDECDHGVEYDEHVWTSPRNAILIVRVITELLCAADPANCAFYRENAAAYIRELEQLDAAFSGVVAGARRRTIVFGDRFPFRYFAETYGLNYFAAFPGCATETEPSAATVAFLINKIRTEQIPVVFHIELSNERMANTISEETGAKKLLLHSVHNVTRRDFEAGLGYLDLKRRNVENLREALH